MTAGSLGVDKYNTSCILCGSRKFHTVEEDSPPFRVLKCNRCSLVFVHPQPSHTELASHYDDYRYYASWYGEQRQAREKMWQNRLLRIEARVDKGRLLDIGCGEGAFLETAQRCGWEVFGTELSEFAALYAAERLGRPVCAGEISAAQFPKAHFDVVTLWHVLEHMQNPILNLREVHRILKPGGLLVVAVPNVDNRIMQLTYRIVKRRRYRLFIPREKELHLFHFSSKTLVKTLSKAGFRCVNLGPDFGIVESAKRLVNLAAVIPYYLSGLHLYNAFETYSIPED